MRYLLIVILFVNSAVMEKKFGVQLVFYEVFFSELIKFTFCKSSIMAA